MSVYTTAFLDLGREKWESFSRTFNEYLDCFMPFIYLLKNSPDRMVVYIDEKVAHRIPPTEGLKIVKINRDWLKANCPTWGLVERGKEILESEDFKSLVKHRRNCPETWNAEYCAINHAKVDLVGLTIDDADYRNFTWFSWVDFGFFKDKTNIPYDLVDTTRLGSGVNYQIINPPQIHALTYILQNAPEYIGGFWFHGKRDDLKEFQFEYYKTLKWLHSVDIEDDDQTVVYLMCQKHPDKFSLWFAGTRQFHKCLKMVQRKSSA